MAQIFLFFFTISSFFPPCTMADEMTASISEIYKTIRNPYFDNIDQLDFLDATLLKNKINNNKILSSSTEINYLLDNLLSDKDNFCRIRKIYKNGLETIAPGLQTFTQLSNLIYNLRNEEQYEILIKSIRSGEQVNKSFAGEKSLLPLFWYNNLLVVLNSPFMQISDSEKARILREKILPFYSGLYAKLGKNNNYIEELQTDCLCMIYVNEGNYFLGYKEIEKLRKSRLGRYSEDDKLMAHPAYLRLSLLMKQKKYETVISEFKKLPKSWLDFGEADKLSMLIFSRIAADAYLELGNDELSKVWRESAITLLFLAEFKSGKDLALDETTKLRSLYLKEKSWTLMRNLEERSAKFGMTPLSKQPGEN